MDAPQINIIVRNRDRKDVRVTKPMCGAECWTDHRLVISKLNLHIHPKRRPQGPKPMKRLNVSQLNNSDAEDKLKTNLKESLGPLEMENQEVEGAWKELTHAVYDTSFQYLGKPTKKY